ARRLGHADRRHLPLHVPFVDRARDVETFVALQADEVAPQAPGERLGERALADSRFALEEERPLELEREEDRGRQAAIGEVIGRGEERLGLLDAQAAFAMARCAITSTSCER